MSESRLRSRRPCPHYMQDELPDVRESGDSDSVKVIHQSERFFTVTRQLCCLQDIAVPGDEVYGTTLECSWTDDRRHQTIPDQVPALPISVS